MSRELIVERIAGLLEINSKDSENLSIASGGNVVLNPVGNIDASSKSIVNVANPVNDQDAATKKYVVDSLIPYLKKDGSVAMTGDLEMGYLAPEEFTEVANLSKTILANDTEAVFTDLFLAPVVTRINIYRTAINGGPVNNFVASCGISFDGLNYYFSAWSIDPGFSVLTITDLSSTIIPAGTASVSFTLTRPAGNPANVQFTAMSGIYTPAVVSTNAIHFVANGAEQYDAVNKGQLDSAIEALSIDSYLKKDGSVPMTGPLNLDGHKIKNVLAGSDPLDAVNKAQLEAAVNGLIWLDPILDPNLFADNLLDPTGATVQNNAMYLVPAAAAGPFTGLEGHVMFYNGTSWVDLLGRAVEVGDRFGVSMYSSINPPEGGLSGYDNYIAEITNATPGSYAYSFIQPVEHDAVFVNNENSPHFAHSYTWNDVWPAGSWVEFSGPGTIEAGLALSWSGNVLNVNVGPGIFVNGSDQLELVLDGSVAASADLSMGLHKLMNLAAGVDAKDAVNKSQLDSTLDAAESYADGVGSSTLSAANLYADGVGSSTLAAANLYTDNAIAAIPDVDLTPYLKRSGTEPMTGPLNMDSHQINNVVDPIAAQDAATKNYVDAAAANSGSWVKYSVTYAQLAAASASNSITLFSLAAKKLIEAVTVVPTAAFVASGAYSVSVGIAGNLEKYGTSYQVSGISPGGAEFENFSTGYSVENLVLDTDILISASVDAGLLSDASAGALDIYVKIGSLPA